jgi:hypothetical protein
MHVFRSIIKPLVLPMFNAGQNFSFRYSITSQFVPTAGTTTA